MEEPHTKERSTPGDMTNDAVEQRIEAGQQRGSVVCHDGEKHQQQSGTTLDVGQQQSYPGNR
ncbi:hypothetical protein E2562_031895 [Oryza meyeriana var. granulata]|uniref:Uncharacterized protein n=1 Tax=Oryza meyeriana var. granulata TaxID=110450 RepID=A0A6G1F064_9ORYZ|nr:hypothetical protein E2562_031895 [Oryza meyeriana var. granulata]